MGRTTVITAGSTYQDIDAYACCVALKELLLLQGVPAVAYSKAPRNYSVHPMLVEPGQMTDRLPQGDLSYIIADVSDPDYLSAGVPLEAVTAPTSSFWARRPPSSGGEGKKPVFPPGCWWRRSWTIRWT